MVMMTIKPSSVLAVYIYICIRMLATAQAVLSEGAHGSSEQENALFWYHHSNRTHAVVHAFYGIVFDRYSRWVSAREREREKE